MWIEYIVFKNELNEKYITILLFKNMVPLEETTEVINFFF